MVERDFKIAVIQEARICLLASAAIKDSTDPANALVVLLSGPLSLFHNQLFDPTAVAARILEQYGWAVSTDALEFFIPKFRSLGWLQSRSEYPARGPFYVDLPEPETEALQTVDTKAALNDLGSAFTSFCSTISPINIIPGDVLEAGALLLKYVVDSPPQGNLGDAQARSEEDYLCARFVEHVSRKNLPAKDILSSLSAVGFLFRVADEIGHPTRKRRSTLRVIVDGPVLLDYLGTSGPTRSEASKDLFKDLRKIGCSVVTFSHCVDEAKDILKMVLKAHPLDRYGPTGEALRRGWVHENVLRALAQSFDLALKQNGVEILPDDINFMPQSHQYFTKDQCAEIENIVNWHDTANDSARYRDSDTTALTIRRRAYHRTSDVFDSKYICVTSNDAFAGSTRRQLQEMHYYNTQQVPPVITLREMAARTWLEVGNKSDDRFRIPQSQLLLSCDRVLRYNKKVVEKAKAELLRVKPEQLSQFELLLEIPRSARAVMDLTLNNERYVSGDTIEQLVEAAIQAAGEEVAAKEKDKRLKESTFLKAQLSKVESDLVSAKHEFDEAVLINNALETSEFDKTNEMLHSISDMATSRLSQIKTLVRVLTFIVAAAPAVAATVSFAMGSSGIYSIGLALLTFILALLAVYDKPGGWLTKIIQNNIDDLLRSRLIEIGRADWANRIIVTWTDGKASADLEPE